MSTSPDPPFESQSQGISLDELAEAFAQAMGGAPKPPADSTYADSDAVQNAPDADHPSVAEKTETQAASDIQAEEEDACPISPLSILEAMLFVGNRDNRPLTPARASELMRDVAHDEIPPLVAELNRRYVSRDAPYRIVCEGDGYRLVLQEEFRSVRNRFFGRIREARLSQAAIDVLALVAYQQPITGEKIGRLRGKPSSHILTHLIRRGLLRIERADDKRRTPCYRTTDRFLKLFNMQSLDDLPRSEDAVPL